MSKLLILLAIVAVLGAGYLSWFKSEAKNMKIVAFGDSLTYGTGSKQGGGFIKILEDDLGVPIENLGVPGDTSADGLARIDEVIKMKPLIVIVFFGGNDIRKGVSPLETAKNLALIDAKLKNIGSRVLLLGLDKLSGVWGHPDLMFDDLHPNDKGYALMAELIEPELKKLLR